MSAPYTESQLRALTVPKLKELLAAHSLPVTGKKDDLVARILAASLGPDTPTTTDTTGPSSSVDEPDGLGQSGLAETTAAVSTETERSAQEVVEGTKAGSAAEESALPAVGGDAAAAQSEADAAAQVEAARLAREQEEERRRKRLERFGGNGAAKEESEEELAKKRRAEKYGIQVEEPAKGDAKLDKSLAALDRPLGSARQRKDKKPDPQSKSSAPSTGGPGVVDAAAPGKKAQASAEPAAAVAADPELAKRLEAEEEKKRKRAERFGGGPAQPEKKAKLDDAPAA
ncbi:hypothetical protein JCM8097_007448 [Rhodosporidiobolus ruineniae]